MKKNSNDYKVSLILPVYNIDENYLKKCVRSLISQTYRNIEIILIDDGSTNNALDVCNKLKEEDNRILVFHQENNGVSIARNLGISKSTGEYICFIDPDDWVENDYVENLLNVIVDNKADISVCGCVVYYTNHSVKNSFLAPSDDNDVNILENEDKNKLLYQLIGKKICSYYPPEVAAGVPWAKMFKKSFIEKYQLQFVPKMARMQDNIFCLYAIQYAERIVYIHKNLYCYRKEEGSTCYKFSPKIIEYFEKYYYETELFLKKFNKEKILQQALNMKKLTSFNSYLSQYFFHKKNNKKYKEKKKEIDCLLEKKIYKEALDNIDYSLLNMQEKIFVFLLKHKKYQFLNCIIKLRNIKKM